MDFRLGGTSGQRCINTCQSIRKITFALGIYSLHSPPLCVCGYCLVLMISFYHSLPPEGRVRVSHLGRSSTSKVNWLANKAAGGGGGEILRSPPSQHWNYRLPHPHAIEKGAGYKYKVLIQRVHTDRLEICLESCRGINMAALASLV